MSEPTATSVLDWARHYLGVHEGRSPSGQWNNLTIFGKQFGWDGVAWCQIFIWCIMHDAHGDALVLKTASCSQEFDWFKRAKHTGQDPRVGALIYFGAMEHVGIVETFDKTHVTYISGNTGDGTVAPGVGNAVERKTIAIGHRNIAGYAYPQYAAAGPRPRRRDLRVIRFKKGQTLAGIAAAAGITLATLLGYNPVYVGHVTAVRPGARITLPATPAPTVTVTATRKPPAKCPKPKPSPKISPTPRRTP